MLAGIVGYARQCNYQYTFIFVEVKLKVNFFKGFYQFHIHFCYVIRETSRCNYLQFFMFYRQIMYVPPYDVPVGIETCSSLSF
jgi:hypothetical protein